MFSIIMNNTIFITVFIAVTKMPEKEDFLLPQGLKKDTVLCGGEHMTKR